MLQTPSILVDEPSQSKNINDTTTLPADAELDLLDIKAAAGLLHVAPISMYRLVEKRSIRFYRVCRRLLFKRQDLVEFVERGKTDKIVCSNYDRSQNTG